MVDELVTEMQDLLRLSGTDANTSTSSNSTDQAQKDKKPMADPDPNVAEEPLFELVNAHGKGLGLFATRSITRGTRIIEEAPLLAVPPRRGLELNMTHFETPLRALNHEQYTKVFELHRGHKVALPKGLSSQQPSGALSRGNILEAAAIFGTNSVAMGEGGEYGSGVFEHYSRINHACNPNVHNSYNPTMKKLTVHAVRQINKGEEIVTSYIAATCRTRQQRQQLLGNWGFECGCKFCIGPRAVESESRRSKMFDMDQQLALYDKKIRLPGFRTPSSPRAALEVCEELLELYRSESITDFSLSLLYRECCKYSLQPGQFDKAVSYAKKDRDVERYCIGTETAHLAEDMKGAEFWLEHVLSKRDAQRKVDEELVTEGKAREMKIAQPKEKAGRRKEKGGKGKKK